MVPVFLPLKVSQLVGNKFGCNVLSQNLLPELQPGRLTCFFRFPHQLSIPVNLASLPFFYSSSFSTLPSSSSSFFRLLLTSILILAKSEKIS